MYELESEMHPTLSDHNNSHQPPEVKLVFLFLLHSGASQDYFLLVVDFLRAGGKAEACGASYIALRHYYMTRMWFVFFKKLIAGSLVLVFLIHTVVALKAEINE